MLSVMQIGVGMIDFDKLDTLFEVTYNENKACMFAYVWAKSKASKNVESHRHISLSEAFSKVKERNWHFYPGDENNLKTFIVTGILNKELGAYETDNITLFLYNINSKKPLEDVSDTNGIKDTTLLEINRTRHDVNYMLGFKNENDFISDFDYKSEKDLKLLISSLNQQKSKAINLIKSNFPDVFDTLKERLNSIV